MSLPTQPFVSKSADELLGELLEHVVAGVITVNHESQTFQSGTNTYTLNCGLPDLTDGQLMEVNRVWGVESNSFREFLLNSDFTVDLANNQITFVTTPDDNTVFNVSYRYDQQKTSGITDISDGSVTRVLMQAVARQFASAWRSLELIKAAAYIETALGDDLDEVVKLVGVTRNEAAAASGYVSFYRETASGDVEVPVSSQVAAPTTEANVVYATQTAVWFRDGFTSVRAPITALAGYEGSVGNMAPNRITKILSATPASRCNNPAYYTDYEFIALSEGNYTNVLAHSPRRVINSAGFVGTNPPWNVTDKGIIAIWSFRDSSMDTASWTDTNVTLTADDPETGQLKCEPSTSTGVYITATFAVNFHTYPHAFVMIRGTADDNFGIQVDGNSLSMFEFISTSSGTDPTVNTNWTLYIGAHFFPQDDGIDQENDPPGSPNTGDRYIVGTAPTGLWSSNTDDIAQYNGSWGFTSPATNYSMYLSTPDKIMYWNGSTWGDYTTSTSTFRIDFGSTNTFWVDLVGMGQELEEVSTLTRERQVRINYTGQTLGFWFSSATANFYLKFDGDDSDGHIDYCFAYYQWDNHISGGGDRETDDALRLRGREALTVAARGTKDAIKNAVLGIEGISQCEVSDYNDDQTIEQGVCHVYVLAQGYTVSPALNQDIIEAIDDVRAAGVQVKVFAPQVRYVNFNLDVVYDDSIRDYLGFEGRQALENLVVSAISDFFDAAQINEALYFSDLYGFLIEEVKGILAGQVEWDDSTTPAISEDDYSGTYAYDGAIVLDNPKRITGVKVDATIVVQGGNSITINLLRRSEKR